MSSRTQETDADGQHKNGSDAASGSHTDDTPNSNALTIALPEGSSSVSDAIITHREMLNAPKEHGLATEDDVEHLSEAFETISGDLNEVRSKHEDKEAEVAELRELVEEQQEQITELQSMISSLAEILGTDTAWESFQENDSS